MKAVVAAFNQEKALVGAFSVITNFRMELFGAPPVSNNLHFNLQTSDCSALFLSLPRNIKVCEYLYDLRLIHISFITKFWSAMADEQISGSGFSAAQHCVSTLGQSLMWCDIIMWCFLAICLDTAQSPTHAHQKYIHWPSQRNSDWISPFSSSWLWKQFHPTKKWEKCFYKCNLK